jgi:hypothetical protein
MAVVALNVSGYLDGLVQLKTFCESNGWTTLRWVAGTELEWIAKGPGLSGKEEVFIGISTYSASAPGIYNWRIATFTGYVEGNTFATQPGAVIKGVPLSFGIMPFRFIVNGQRIIVTMDVQGYHQAMYLGKYFPQATPSEYPHPMCSAGMLNSASLTKYNATYDSLGSGVRYDAPFTGGVDTMSLTLRDGSVIKPKSWIHDNGVGAGHTIDSTTVQHFYLRDSLIDTGGYFPLFPIILMDSTNIYGELDGVYWVPKASQNIGNIVQIDGVDHVIIKCYWMPRIAYLPYNNEFFALKWT